MDSQSLLLREKVRAHADYLAATIAHSKNRVSDLDHEMQTRMGALTQDGATKLLKARRMIAALERRLDKLTAVMSQTGQSAVFDAFRLSQSAIAVPNDPVHALLTEKPMPDMNPMTVRRDLEALLGSIQLQEPKRAY